MFNLLLPALPSAQATKGAAIDLDAPHKAAILRDRSGRLKLRLSFARGCVLDDVELFGKGVLAPTEGLWSGVKVAGRWFTTADLSHPPTVSQKGGRLEISGIEYGGGGLRVGETWTFVVKDDAIEWKIDRRYLRGGTLDDTAMPRATFASGSTWTGALLGTGGVAWGKLLDAPNATYGAHTDSATFWNATSDACLRFAATDKGGSAKALRFTREPDGGFSMASAVTRDAMRTKYGKARFRRRGQDVWAPFAVSASQAVSATYELKALGYRQTYGRGDFKGLDTAAITEMLNTIGRIGVIDEGLVGSNGWYSGYICMHEPWLARVGTAIDDPNYRRTAAEFLDDARQHAISPDGLVKSRWKYDAGDAQPGTYDGASGFYEAQWGRLMDAQTSYITNVADEFDASGDRAWVARQKGACEAALDYLLRRDADGDALVEMANSATSQRRSSDWLDIVWASHENAFVNAQLYGALRKWAAVESLLGDDARATVYGDFATRLKTSFNRPLAEGGFWNPTKGWYVYWRDADGSVHGDNLTVPVNLTALGEGLCDDPQRRRTLLDAMETRMKAESLLAWPACFESYAPGEGANDTFPTYENGDIFLAWAEYGIRAYAPTEPGLALEYVRRIVEQYKKDGLAYQRYLRKDGKGVGDDILANNVNVLTGLYRDIYGIQPKHNRLALEPHLVPELNGTRVEYELRGRHLQIDLSTDDYRVRNERVTMRSSQPFGVDFGKNRVAYFVHNGEKPALTIEGVGAAPVTIAFGDWTKQKRWTVLSGSNAIAAVHTFHDLKPGLRYAVVAAGKPIATVSVKKPSARILCRAGRPTQLGLIVLPSRPQESPVNRQRFVPAREGNGVRSSFFTGLKLGKQPLKVQRPREHLEIAVAIPRPFGLGAVPVQLDPVSVRVTEVKSLAHPMVGRAIERPLGFYEAAKRVGKAATVGIQNRGVEKARRARRRLGAALAHPGIQPNVMVVAARREEDGAMPITLGDLEAENALVKGQGSIQIGHLKVNVADADSGIDRVHYKSYSTRGTRRALDDFLHHERAD